MIKKIVKAGVVTLADTAVGRRLLRSYAKPFVPVFMLHRFATPDGAIDGHAPELVRAALGYVRRLGLEVLSIDEAVERCRDGTLRGNAVAFTIDDGYFDQAEVGADLFLEFDCPVTIYVTTGLLDGTFLPMESQVACLFEQIESPIELRVGTNTELLSPADPAGLRRARRRWVESLKPLPLDRSLAMIREFAERLGVPQPLRPAGKYRGMSWGDLARLEQRGVSFGPHTVRHVTLSAEDDATSRAELAAADQGLRARALRPSRVYCYPTGRRQDYGAREIGYVKELGYCGAISAEPGYFDVQQGRADDAALFNIARFGFPDNMTDFKDLILQTQRIREALQRRMQIASAGRR